LNTFGGSGGGWCWVVVDGGWWLQVITLSQPNYSFNCFVVKVVVVVGL